MLTYTTTTALQTAKIEASIVDTTNSNITHAISTFIDLITRNDKSELEGLEYCGKKKYILNSAISGKICGLEFC